MITFKEFINEANSWEPDYSKHDTEHLKTLLKPGVLHKSESKYKMFIRRELKKRETNKDKKIAE